MKIMTSVHIIISQSPRSWTTLIVSTNARVEQDHARQYVVWMGTAVAMEAIGKGKDVPLSSKTLLLHTDTHV